ncbi:MAG: gamma-glutamyl-gamma-aminobutyrate hydrolase family protein [Candidatus Rifleibacteriota bacterium]
MKLLKKLAAFLFVVVFSASISAQAAKRPLIGLNAAFKNDKVILNYDYVRAINNNGGVAVILPPADNDEIIKKYVSMVDAAVFTGGRDIPPEFYGQERHPSVNVLDQIRFEFDSRFIKAFLLSKKPVLGICLGMQMSNVIHGGTMIQDIPSMVGGKVRHRNGEMYTNFHPVGIAKGSLLANILGKDDAEVISRHHQAVDKIGENLRVIARSSDGIVEALERTDRHFGLFVQWHPESLKKVSPQHTNRIFSALVRAAKKQSH